MTKITLSNGKVLDNLSILGSNFVSQTAIALSDFDGGLSRVVIDYPNGTVVKNEMALVFLEEKESEWWFALRERSAQELEHEALLEKIDAMDAQQSWTALMTNTVMEV